MSRAPGAAPRFDRLFSYLTQAKEAWDSGDVAKSEHLLEMVGSIAITESKERGPKGVVPE